MSRFSYVRYDSLAQKSQQTFKAKFDDLEAYVSSLPDGRAKALAFTKLEEAYLWIGKSIRDDQIQRLGSQDECLERGQEPVPADLPQDPELSLNAADA